MACRQIAHYQQIFETIKEATGVSEPRDVVEKFSAQDSTHGLLLTLIRESQGKIDQLNVVRATEQRRLMQARFQAKPSEETPCEARREGGGTGEKPSLPSELDQKAQSRAQTELRARQRAVRSRRITNLLVDVETAVAQLKALLSAGEAALSKRGEAEPAPSAVALDVVGELELACKQLARIGEEVRRKVSAESEGREVEALVAAASQVPVSFSARRMTRELAEVSLLADDDDLDLHNMSGPIIKMGAANYRLQVQRNLVLQPRTPTLNRNPEAQTPKMSSVLTRSCGCGVAGRCARVTACAGG